MTETYANLLIHIGPLDTGKGTYPVEAELDDGVLFTGGELNIDFNRLAELRLDPAEYGAALFDALFTGPMLAAYLQALSQMDGRLRIQLRIDNAASELLGLLWEGMYGAHTEQHVPFAVLLQTPFSRYLPQSRPSPPPVPPPAKGQPIRMLFAVSNPTNLEQYGLTPLAVDREVAKLRQSIGQLQQSGLLTVRVMVGRTGLSSSLRQELAVEGYEVLDGPITLAHLVDQMRDCQLVHLMCHGRTSKGNDMAALGLEGADGAAQIIRDRDLIKTLVTAPQLPRLLFLMSGDQSRGTGENPHVAMGRALVNAGIPAAIVMQGIITIEGASLLTSAFYARLLRHGYVDMALNEARLDLFNHQGGKGSDWLMPVLWTSLRTSHLISLAETIAKSASRSVAIAEPQPEPAQLESLPSPLDGDARFLELTSRLRFLADSLRQLQTLVDLANQLQQISEFFDPCARIVQQAGQDLMTIQIVPLGWVWQPLRNGSLKRLQLFIQQHSQLVAEWHPLLLEQAEIIDNSLKETNMGGLAKGVTTFHRQLAEAQPSVRQQMDQAIAQLVSYSDQTLGRLDTE